VNRAVYFSLRAQARQVPRDGRPAEHLFTIRDRSMAAFAGIWRSSEQVKVFAFLTCDPNPLVAAVHPKAMPVILDPEDYEGWLGGEHDSACALATAYPSQLMKMA
jgi:putative SOS response-associated peptidase YedK